MFTCWTNSSVRLNKLSFRSNSCAPFRYVTTFLFLIISTLKLCLLSLKILQKNVLTVLQPWNSSSSEHAGCPLPRSFSSIVSRVCLCLFSVACFHNTLSVFDGCVFAQRLDCSKNGTFGWESWNIPRRYNVYVSFFLYLQFVTKSIFVFVHLLRF